MPHVLHCPHLSCVTCGTKEECGRKDKAIAFNMVKDQSELTEIPISQKLR
jgi:hypothetical protein